MININKKGGFSLIEMLLVVSTIGIVIAIGASSISVTSVFRRNVDDITNYVGSTLHFTKMKSTREGTEYRLTFADCTTSNTSDADCEICSNYEEYSSGDETLNLIVERGDSNAGSTTWCIQKTYSRRFQTPVEIVMSGNIATSPLRISFSPNGMRSDFRDDTGVEVVIIAPADNAKVDKCGQVGVNPVGSITAIQGRWDDSDSECNPILDEEPGP